MRAMRAARPAIENARGRLNTALGLPRCDRLAGLATGYSGRALRACACTDAADPVASCQYATRDESFPLELKTNSHWALPMRSRHDEHLTPGQQGQIADVDDSDIVEAPGPV